MLLWRPPGPGGIIIGAFHWPASSRHSETCVTKSITRHQIPQTVSFRSEFLVREVFRTSNLHWRAETAHVETRPEPVALKHCMAGPDGCICCDCTTGARENKSEYM